MFDLNNKKSFNNIKKWIDFFDKYKQKEKILKYLVGNKKDLEREVNSDVIELFLEENKDYKYKETSAKDENDNKINELFQEMGEDLYIFASKRKNNEKKKVKLTYYKEKKPSKCKNCII